MSTNASMGSSETNSATKIRRLATFFVVCIIMGIGALFVLFAPNINPSFINECLFYPAPSDSLPYEWEGGVGYPTEIANTMGELEHAFTSKDFKRLGVPEPEDVSFKSADGTTLHGWFFKTPSDRGTVLFNWNAICDMRFPLQLGYVKLLQNAKLSVFMYDYRGFGKSEGSPESLSTFALDGESAYYYLLNQRKIPADKIVLMGSQLGCYIALDQNAHHACKAMILETPWTNLKKWIDEVPAAQAMRIVPESFYPNGAFDSTHFVTGKHPPMLFVFTTALPDHGENLFAAAAAPKESLKVRAARKLDIPFLSHEGPQYTKAVSDLVRN